jgi:hypothetical protein
VNDTHAPTASPLTLVEELDEAGPGLVYRISMQIQFGLNAEGTAAQLGDLAVLYPWSPKNQLLARFHFSEVDMVGKRFRQDGAFVQPRLARQRGRAPRRQYDLLLLERPDVCDVLPEQFGFGWVGSL